LLGPPIVLSAVAQDRIIGVASVVDGDSIEIHGQRILLLGIERPASSQFCVRPTGERWRCGQQASFALADWIRCVTVSCPPHDVDRYVRVVAVCFKGNEDLSRWMVLKRLGRRI
jgi:endonuclease YncB( thermonuclease family)